MLMEAQQRHEDGWWMYTWNCGAALAEFLVEHNIIDKHILEVGPGLGLASIVAIDLGNVVHTIDRQPLVNEYLTINAIANEVTPPIYVEHGFESPEKYEVVMAATTLYNNATVDYLLSKMYEKVAPSGQLILVEYYKTNAWSKIHKFISDNNIPHRVYEKDAKQLGDAPIQEESYFMEIFVISKD